MDKLCFSIDEERYDDRHGHVLSLVGWYMHPEKKKCIFQLLGDGYEVIRRICRYVVTRRLLRRDASDVTS